MMVVVLAQPTLMLADHRAAGFLHCNKDSAKVWGPKFKAAAGLAGDERPRSDT